MAEQLEVAIQQEIQKKWQEKLIRYKQKIKFHKTLAEQQKLKFKTDYEQSQQTINDLETRLIL